MPKDTERSSRGPCLLFQVTAIGANRHWLNCVPSFPANPRCKKSLLMVEYHGDMLWGGVATSRREAMAHPTIHMGSTGPEVKLAQEALQKRGYNPGPID